MATCTGTTKKGKPCGAKARKGTERCGRHPLDASDTDTRPRDERWSREGFLLCFEWSGMVSAACELMGVGRSTVYLERQRNEYFALAWADVEERSTERMEVEALRRAVDGVEAPLVSAGKLVTTERKYSDQLLMFMLKSRRPEKYRDRVDVNHSGKIEKRVKVDLAKLDDDELEALERIAAKLEQPDPVPA
jgi:hypothetical protein